MPRCCCPKQDAETAGTGSPLLVAEEEAGICRVICFSPRHDLSLPLMQPADVEAVVRTWREQTVELGAMDFINYVQIFENNGAMMGASNPHPHSQIWATGHIPNEPATELARQGDYLREHGSCLLCDYVAEERKRRAGGGGKRAFHGPGAFLGGVAV